MSSGMNGTKSRGVFSSIEEMKAANLRVGVRVDVYGGDTYDIYATNQGSSIELDNGLWAEIVVTGGASEGYVQNYVGSVTNYQAASVADMVLGKTIGGNTVALEVGQVWTINGTWRHNGGMSGTIADFDALDDIQIADFGVVPGQQDDANFNLALSTMTSQRRFLKFSAGEYIYGGSYISSGNGVYFKGERGRLTKIKTLHNGVVFEAHGDFYNPSRLIDICFEDLSGGDDSISLKLRRGNAWGATAHMDNVRFIGYGDCAVFAINLYQSIWNAVTIDGRTQYVAGDNFKNSKDVGLKLWGADGTLELQDHLFSNVNSFNTCAFQNTTIGVWGEGIYKSTFKDCVFQQCWAGITNAGNDSGDSGQVSSLERSGFGVAEVTLDSTWFENMAGMLVSGNRLNFSDGTFEDSLKKGQYIDTGNFYASNPAPSNENLPDNFFPGSSSGYLQQNGTDTSETKPKLLLFYAAANPNKTYLQLRTDRFITDLPLTIGARSGGTPISIYKKGLFTPKLRDASGNPLSSLITSSYVLTGDTCRVYVNYYNDSGQNPFNPSDDLFIDIAEIGLPSFTMSSCANVRNLSKIAGTYPGPVTATISSESLIAIQTMETGDTKSRGITMNDSNANLTISLSFAIDIML